MADKNRKKKLNSVIAPLTEPADVRRIVNADTRLQIKPMRRQLQAERRASRQQSQNIKSWYQQHQQQLGNLRKQGIRQTNRTLDAAENQQALAGYQDASNRQALMDEERRSAELRGVDPSTTGMSVGLEAANQRANLAGIASNRIAQQGQANANMLGQIKAASTLGRNSMLREERNTRRNINQDARDLVQRGADYRVKYGREIQKGERDWWLQRKTLTGKADYNDAIRDVAAMGLAGKQASANATTTAAELYSGAKIKAAQIYGRTKSGEEITGADIQRAGSYIRATLGKSGADWRQVKRNPNRVTDALVNRGVDPKTARMAVRRFVTRKEKMAAANKWPNREAPGGGRR